MSLLSRLSAPAATDELAAVVAALLAKPKPAESRQLSEAIELPSDPDDARSGGHRPDDAATVGPRLLAGPTGLGTSAARVLAPAAADAAAPAFRTPARQPEPGVRIPRFPTGLGTSALRIVPPSRPDDTSDKADAVPQLYCPGPVRDDKALGEQVNEELVAWAGEIGIYPGQLDVVRAANFGRLIMLAHPESNDPDRLLAAAKCALAEWAVDDHYVDGDAGETEPELLGQRLAIAYAVVDPAHLPARYAPQLAAAVQEDPVMVALGSSLDNLAKYASAKQVARLRHELAVMFVAYNQEGVWRTSGHTPSVWEYLTHRHENSFVPCMALIDAVAGYELPHTEFADPRVRRVFTLAGSATVLMNDLYSMAKEDPTDTNLPRLIAREDECSLHEAIERSVELHDELMHTFEQEAAALSLVGSPALRRFLGGVWAWLGGNREWHRTSARYSTA